MGVNCQYSLLVHSLRPGHLTPLQSYFDISPLLTFSPLSTFSHFQIVPMTLNPELQILTLQHNQISQIGSASFQFHPELLEVDLSNNGLKDVQVVTLGNKRKFDEYYHHFRSPPGFTTRD